jgi:hypothetical protein
MSYIVGVSGKLGSGKNYLVEKLMEKIIERGQTAGYGFFAYTLKQELNNIMTHYYPYAVAHMITEGIHSTSEAFNIPLGQMEKLLGMIHDDLLANPAVDSLVNRSKGIRDGLQFLGTDIRRKVSPNYWVDAFYRGAEDSSEDYMFVTDTRFPNEADSVLSHHGVALRLEVPAEIIAERIFKRDGLVYTEEQLTHESETALDDYKKFDIIVGATFDVDEILHNIDQLLAARRKV